MSGFRKLGHIYAILPHAFDSTDTTLSRDKAHVMYYGYHDRC